MAGVKPGMGKASEHSTNKQFGKGPGATNHPLKKSTTNPTPPLMEHAKGHGAKSPTTRPNTPGSDSNRVLLEQNQAGKSRTSSTFTAPRKSSGGDSAVECGYTKPGKM